MSKVYVKDATRPAFRAGRNASRPEPGGGGAAERPKAPSFLAQVKAAFTDLVGAQAEHTITPENVGEFVTQVWPVVSKALARSYYNGARDFRDGRIPEAKLKRKGA